MKREVTLRFAGAAGQGVQSAAAVLGRAITKAGLFASSHCEVESRVRGGMNFFQFNVATEQTAGVAASADILIALTEETLAQSQALVRPGGLILSPESSPFGLAALARQAGSNKTIGTVGFAVAAALLNLDATEIIRLVTERFSGLSESMLTANQQACALAYEAVAAHFPENDYALLAVANDELATAATRLWISGHEALSLGAVAGGVSFIAAYPMSPATGCLTNLSAWANETGIIAVQVEDEVAAINMVAGASYAGARAMTASSGGGIALMTEGISLLGEIEAPAVIVVAQRPGPATGMATRTAQEDLLMVIHSGHGYFPRIVLAPRDLADCFELTAQAFSLAERFQVPVFIMTDQLLQDSAQTLAPFTVSDLPTKRHAVTGDELSRQAEYHRYEHTESGISPLAYPGASTHTVMVDSHIHDIDGHLTEDGANASAMAEKQLKKTRTIAEAMVTPELVGPLAAPLVVTWGSTYDTTERALRLCATAGITCAHVNLRWLWPAPREALCQLFEECQRVIAIDNSVGGIFADYLSNVTGLRPDAVLTKLDGRPFTDEELASLLKAEVQP